MEAEEAGPGRVRVAQTKEDLAKVTRGVRQSEMHMFGCQSFLSWGTLTTRTPTTRTTRRTHHQRRLSVCLSIGLTLSLSLSLSAGK